MTSLVAILLGFTEGATEFIPVSSSGHLIILREILGANNLGGLSFDAVLQFSATLALVVYFRKDIHGLILNFLKLITGKNLENKEKILLFSIIFGTLPAVFVGLFLEKYMESIFRNIQLVGVMLLFGSILMWCADRIATKDKPLSLKKGIMVGFFQCLALVPGISRSGATISGGLFLGLKQDEVVRFSFLLSLPILLGAGFLKLFEVRHEILTTSFGLPLFLGSITAFVTGLLAINFLIKYLKNHNLNVFIYYRIALFIAIFLFL